MSIKKTGHLVLRYPVYWVARGIVRESTVSPSFYRTNGVLHNRRCAETSRRNPHRLVSVHAQHHVMRAGRNQVARLVGVLRSAHGTRERYVPEGLDPLALIFECENGSRLPEAEFHESRLDPKVGRSTHVVARNHLSCNK